MFSIMRIGFQCTYSYCCFFCVASPPTEDDESFGQSSTEPSTRLIPNPQKSSIVNKMNFQTLNATSAKELMCGKLEEGTGLFQKGTQWVPSLFEVQFQELVGRNPLTDTCIVMFICLHDCSGILMEGM